MNYNIIYTQKRPIGETYLFALDEKMLNKFIESYNNGESNFFYRGKSEDMSQIREIIIYDTRNGSSDFPANDLYDQLIQINNSNRILGMEQTFRKLGKVVTEDFIKGPYGSLKVISEAKAIAVKSEYHINNNRIEELRQINNPNFDLTKLIKLCKELNSSFQNENYFAVGALIRAILDHVPPIFGFKKFTEVANNYNSPGSSKSFKESMMHLENSMRNISDRFLHSTITKSENLPNDTQVDCKRDLDVLLGEIVRIIRGKVV